jgi:hypothetical protein
LNPLEVALFFGAFGADFCTSRSPPSLNRLRSTPGSERGLGAEARSFAFGFFESGFDDAGCAPGEIAAAHTNQVVASQQQGRLGVFDFAAPMVGGRIV